MSHESGNLSCDDSFKWPVVEAVIVTWNKKGFVLNLLRQLETIDYPRKMFSVTVVDNNSTDGTASAIKSSFPWVSLIENESNLGGTGGFNCGMRQALEKQPECDYLWLLDNDVVVERETLLSLVRVMEQNPDAALCGSRIMDVDNPENVVEVGAFIDWKSGDVRQNIPSAEELRDDNAIFAVDYVAACSLLARAEHVRALGLWHEHFFIYWDDMEWGARCNAFGYEVLAANASIVYHPSWAGRIADNSAIWRNYYRSRNSLWFYDTYLTGPRRLLAKACMVTKFMKYSFSACLVCQSALSQAFIAGVRDFFLGNYGKKALEIPPYELGKYKKEEKNHNICLFLSGGEKSEDVKKFLGNLEELWGKLKLTVVVPEILLSEFGELCTKERIFGYKRSASGRITVFERWKIFWFLKKLDWNLLITSSAVPRVAAIMRRDVMRIDFPRGKVLTIDRVKIEDLLLAMKYCFLFLVKLVSSTSERDLKWIKNIEGTTGRKFSPRLKGKAKPRALGPNVSLEG